MAIYHLSTKPISRSSGRSAVASIAYRAGIKITDERLGKTYDYTKRHGVLWTGLAIPNDFKIDRNELWNLAEKSENRKNSRTAREIVINIPHELMSGDQTTGKMLAYEFASQLSNKYQIAVDVAVHAPDKHGDNRNYHAHLLLTTRKIEQDQHSKIKLTDKSQLEMSNTQLKQAGLLSNQDELKEIRKAWAELANVYLDKHGINEHIDHRSHADRGLNILPTVKMGWQATELERKGIRTDVGDINRAIKAYNETIKKQEIIEQPKKSATKDNHLRKAYIQRKIRQAKAQEQAPKPTPQPSQNAFEENRQIYLDYAKKIENTAKEVLSKELEDMRNKGMPLLAKFEELRDNKPLFFGKEKWEKDKEQALNAYNRFRDNYYSVKDKGVTGEHIERAKELIAEREPTYHAKVQRAIEVLSEINKARMDAKAREHGADEHAQKGKRYIGKILQVDKNGIIQETAEGKIYHPYMGSIKEGKSYDLKNEGDIYEVRELYEIKQRESSRDMGMER